MRPDERYSVLEPVDPATVRTYLRQFRPNGVDRLAWMDSPARRFVVDSLTGFEFRHKSDMQAITGVFARLVRYCEAEGIPLDLELVLDPAVVEAFLIKVEPHRTAPMRFLCRRLGLALTKSAPWTQGERRGKHPPQTRVEPYGPDDIESMWRLAQRQSSVVRRRTALALMCLGHGAGLRPKEVLWAQVADVEVTPGGAALVRVGQPNPRVVPVLERYSAPLVQLCEGLEADEFITGRDAKTYSTTALTYQLDDSRTRAVDIPLIRPPRLRMTWVRDLIVAGVPIVDVNAAAGGIGGRTLAHLLNQLEPSAETEHRTLIAGALS